MEDRAMITEDVQISATGSPGEFTMQGVLTIEHAVEVRKELVDMLGRHDSVVVQIGSGARTDLSFLQLLCSTCRTALKQEKSFSVRKDVPDSYCFLLNEAGYSRKKGCGLDTDNTCIWIPGEGR